ncbi:molybdopterin-dependent oxidoreductase Mo/Fe-S-binding subunit [Salidesulfovibrio onnuriiensis]|uniref:molybdopterin-dependent oxidoreductase Mo/Fe-S-binding subunit n=1 Tax=Salidesulfovibrio onnuriiensis TaxID=2583823 RepID=UPI0011C77AE3|nr:molybdopterin-dependent oxidoreductase Mo/Fe-S-binding subunit [Salidesulfovibrio onnuriiensis]
MMITFTLNGTSRTVDVEPGANAQVFLQRSMHIPSVRSGDDGTGFIGNDVVLVDGTPMSAQHLIMAQLDGKEVRTVESLNEDMIKPGKLQQALIEAGVVQDGYNTPAAALLLGELLERSASPSRREIIDALSGLFVRDCGYEPYFKAVDIYKAKTEGRDFGAVAPSFREDLRVVGTPSPKIDGPWLATGQRAYVEDRVAPDALIIRMLRSPHAHAYITSIDVSEAEKVHGVHLVITHENCPDVSFTQAGQGFPEPSPYDRRMFNIKVRHVGDRVAAVVAETEEAAQEAISKIKVEYDVIEPVFSIDDAKREGAPLVQAGPMEYVCGAPENLAELNRDADERDGAVTYQFPIGANTRKNIAASISGGIGDMQKGFAEADVVIERTYDSCQIHCTPPETHVVYCHMEGGRVVVHTATQVPWHVRRLVSKVIGLPQNKVRVVKERVGGGYGSKQDILLEDVCAWATLKTGKPVYSHYTREEEFTACSSRHPMRVTVKLGARKDGTLTAVEMHNEANTGPYGNHCLTVPMNACSKSLPLFLCDNVAFSVTVYYSNIPPTGAYQGYGAPQGSFGLQLAVAELARELGLPHMDIIEKNRVREGSRLELMRILGEGREGVAADIKSCGLEGALKRGDELLKLNEKVESDDPDWKVGKGFAIIQQGSGLPGLDQANGRANLCSDGTILVQQGGADIGTGLDTVMAKMTAETLNVALEDVTVISGDTDMTPFDTGAYASSGTYFSGGAALLAARDLRKNILQTAADMLDAKVEDLDIAYPGVVVGGKEELTFAKIAHHCETGEGPGPISGKGCFVTEHHAIPYGAHFAQVAVNIRTGQVKVQKYYALHDCGTPVNPELAEGQVLGGALKSIGHSLWEEMILDDKGELVNPSMHEYCVPTILDKPEDFRAEFIFTDDPYGPHGAKSVSEIATNGASPALAAAIHDAVGVWIRQWPFTPERILKALGTI